MSNDVCAEDCDPGENSEDHRVHSSHESCDVCPYHVSHG